LIRQRLNAKDEELMARNTELTAETKRHNEALQIISDMKEEARVSAEQVRTLRDEMKRIDGVMKDRVTWAERQRDEDRQMISDIKKMQQTLETRLMANS
jgi:Zn-dependent peptidase ImmA (M78 family)